jgi:hypothetical protein
LNQQDARLIPLLDRIDVKVTPELCEAARKCWRSSVDRYKPTPARPSFSLVEDELNQYSINARWLLDGHCDCRAEIAKLAEVIAPYPDEFSKRSFVQSLEGLR